MKKAVSIFLIIICVLSGCNSLENSSEESVQPTYTNHEFTKGVWLSFNEVNSLLTDNFRSDFGNVINNLKSLKITDLYFHIRSHCDSVVKSDYFPQTELSKTQDFDILEYVINACHSDNIRVHAWINPYRVNAADSDIGSLPADSPVVKWLNDQDSENDKNVCIINGIYLNPAENEVRQLIVNGVKEIINNYNVDGIHFDDYFYPATDQNFDSVSYEAYKNTTEHPLKLDDWRRANVDTLIADCNLAIKSKDRNIIFSISPSADIEKNYNARYADISSWCKDGLIDEVIPQLYFGFNHTDPQFCFNNLIKEWTKLCNNSKAQLKIGLAPYKIGTESISDGTEWQTNTNILARQFEICKNNNLINGICFFSYSSLFSNEEANTKERENLIGVS